MSISIFRKTRFFHLLLVVSFLALPCPTYAGLDDSFSDREGGAGHVVGRLGVGAAVAAAAVAGALLFVGKWFGGGRRSSAGTPSADVVIDNLSSASKGSLTSSDEILQDLPSHVSLRNLKEIEQKVRVGQCGVWFVQGNTLRQTHNPSEFLQGGILGVCSTETVKSLSLAQQFKERNLYRHLREEGLVRKVFLRINQDYHPQVAAVFRSYLEWDQNSTFRFLTVVQGNSSLGCVVVQGSRLPALFSYVMVQLAPITGSGSQSPQSSPRAPAQPPVVVAEQALAVAAQALKAAREQQSATGQGSDTGASPTQSSVEVPAAASVPTARRTAQEPVAQPLRPTSTRRPLPPIPGNPSASVASNLGASIDSLAPEGHLSANGSLERSQPVAMELPSAELVGSTTPRRPLRSTSPQEALLAQQAAAVIAARNPSSQADPLAVHPVISNVDAAVAAVHGDLSPIPLSSSKDDNISQVYSVGQLTALASRYSASVSQFSLAIEDPKAKIERLMGDPLPPFLSSLRQALTPFPTEDIFLCGKEDRFTVTTKEHFGPGAYFVCSVVNLPLTFEAQQALRSRFANEPEDQAFLFKTFDPAAHGLLAFSLSLCESNSDATFKVGRSQKIEQDHGFVVFSLPQPDGSSKCLYMVLKLKPVRSRIGPASAGSSSLTPRFSFRPPLAPAGPSSRP